MGIFGASALAGAMLFTNTTVSWDTFHSSLYPYSISQPSSFLHITIALTPDRRVDYFYPSLGSATTNVNVSAVTGHTLISEPSYLRSLDGRNVRRSAWIYIAGQQLPLMCADFQSIMGKYRIEQLAFVAGGMVWRVTASYDLRYQNMRSMMIRMLQSFKLQSAARTHHNP
jgi:hypothetical protein